MNNSVIRNSNGKERDIAVWGENLAANSSYTVTVGTVENGNFVADTYADGTESRARTLQSFVRKWQTLFRI